MTLSGTEPYIYDDLEWYRNLHIPWFFLYDGSMIEHHYRLDSKKGTIASHPRTQL